MAGQQPALLSTRHGALAALAPTGADAATRAVACSCAGVSRSTGHCHQP
jgi:hypothetical protein